MKFSDGYNSIIKNASFLYASLLINQFLRFLYVIVLARFLGPDLYGLFSYGLAWYTAFLPLSMLGLGAILVREISRNHKEGVHVANTIATIRVVSILFTAIACNVISWIINDTSNLSTLILIFSFALIGRAVSIWGDQMFNAYEKTQFTFNQEKYFRISEVIIGICIAIITEDIFLLAISHAFIWILQGVRAVFLVQKNLQILTLNWDWEKIKRLIYLGAPLGFSLVLDTLLIQGAIIIYKTNGATNELIGNLVIIIQAFTVIASIFLAGSKAVLPVISRSVERGDSKDRIYISVMSRIAFILGIILGLFGLTLGEDVVSIVFSTQYNTAMEHLGLILWLLIPYILKLTANTTLLAHGHFVKILKFNFLGFISMTISILYLLSDYAFTGVVIGILIGYSMAAGLGILYLIRLKFIDQISDIIKLILIGIGILLLYHIILEYHELFALVISSFIFFISLFVFNIIKKKETILIKNILMRLYR